MIFQKSPEAADSCLVMLNYHGAAFLFCWGGDFLPRGGGWDMKARIMRRVASEAAGGPSTSAASGGNGGSGMAKVGVEKVQRAEIGARCLDGKRKCSGMRSANSASRARCTAQRRDSPCGDKEAPHFQVPVEAMAAEFAPRRAIDASTPPENAASPAAAAATSSSKFDLSALKERAVAMLLGDVRVLRDGGGSCHYP